MFTNHLRLNAPTLLRLQDHTRQLRPLCIERIVRNFLVHLANLLQFVTVIRIRQPNIVPKVELVLAQPSLSQHGVKPFGPFGREPLHLIRFLLLPRHF